MNTLEVPGNETNLMDNINAKLDSKHISLDRVQTIFIEKDLRESGCYKATVYYR